MDLMRLDKNTYLADKFVEGYSSLIWTERYLDAGEFELKTPLVLETMALLPENSLVSHRETDEVMLVETHSIGKDQAGFNELTIKGRSLDSFAERRALEGPYPKKKYKMARDYTTAEAASILLWNAFVNPSVNDVTRIGAGTRSTLDNIPNTVVTDSTTGTYARKRRWLEGGQVYPLMLDLLRTDKLGVRTIRPQSNARKVVSVTTNDKGIISYTNQPSTGSLRFDIYNGVNRSVEQSVNKEVVFHYAGDYLSDESYLFSTAEYDTEALIISEVGTRRLYRDKRADSTLSGLARRVRWIDGGEPDPKESRAEFLEDLSDLAAQEFEKRDRVRLFDCKIDTTSPYTYGEHYFLGDRVTLVGEFDFNDTMWVVEHVRIHDNTGDVSYPVLAADLDAEE